MKRITKVLGTSIGVAAALALSVSSTQANILTDPGFESGAPGQNNPIPVPAGAGGGWALFNSASYAAAAAETGSYGIQESEGAGSAWNFGGAYQLIGGASAGASYTLTADYKAITPLSAYNPVFIQLTFFDATGADLGTVQTSPGHALAVQYGAPVVGNWYQATVTATAPAGAVYVGPYLAMMENGGNAAPETIYWDNASLTPEPSTLALLALGIPAYLLRRKIG